MASERGASEPSPSLERSAALVCRNLFRETSTLLSIGRFELVRTLGRGGRGIVYEALDPLRCERVALKVLHNRGPIHVYRLKSEFRSLAQLRHPNLVALHELSISGDDAYFTMDLIHGRDFLAHTRDGAPLGTLPRDERRLRDALAQLCEGVRALHGAGKLHRDLKPSNVLVTRTGRVCLLDFGLVDDMRGGASSPEGTPAYMAPEQARGAASESSDWYSFGRVLQQALYGQQAAAVNVWPLASSRGLRALEQLALRLLDPDPERRPGFDEIIAVVRKTTPPAIGLRPSAAPASPPFVGRARERARLADAFARSRTRPVVVLVRGEAGLGKSALIRQFAQTVLEPARALVLRGACYERESLPYKALDSAVDELSRVLLALPPESDPRIASQERAALLAVFPVLGSVPWLQADAPAQATPVHPVELRRRGFAALKQLLAMLARERPLVLCIDDLQWSDHDSGHLLGALLCDEDSPPLLVIASDRGDARAVNPALEELQRIAELAPRPLALETLDLGPLETDTAAELARFWLGAAASDAAVAQVAAESHGNPLFLKELARGLADAAQRAGGDTREPPSIAALFERRLQALAEPSLAILQLVAAAGRPIATAVVARAAGTGTETHAHIRELRAAGLLRAVLRNTDELLELDHERMAEAVLQRIDASARVELHARLARALELELEQGPASEALIDHYVGARMPFEAARSARRAGDVALAALAFTRAARLYEQALALGGFDPEELAALHESRAVALEHCGRGLEAAAAYMQATRHTRDAIAVAQLEQRAARQLMHNGRLEEGERLLGSGYRALGLTWPRSRIGLTLALLRQLLPPRLRRLQLRKRSVSTELRYARARLTAEGGSGLEHYDVMRALYNALVSCDAGEQVPDPVWHARAAGARGLLRSILLPGGDARGTAALEAACAAADALGDVPAQADLYNQLASVHYFNCRLLPALEAANRAETHMRALPRTPTDLYSTMGLIGSSLVELGRLREARRRCEAFAHEARMHGDLMTMTWVHTHPAHLAYLVTSGEHARVRAMLDLQARLRARHPRYLLIGWSHAACSVEHALYAGEAGDALRLLAREQRLLFGQRYLVMTLRARHMRARACLAAASELPPGRPRAALLRQAARDAFVLRRTRAPFMRGQIYLMDAGIALLRGRPERALRLLDQGLPLLEASHAKLVVAAANYCRGVLIGGEQGEALRREAWRTIADEDVVEPWRYIVACASGFRAVVGRNG